MVTELIEEGKAKIQVLRSTDKWYGVTYREDKPLVVEAIARKTAEGQYPENLWAGPFKMPSAWLWAPGTTFL